jgi:hypothetical protein
MAQEYATLAQFKTRLAHNINPDADTELGDILEAASRAVDDYLEVRSGYFYPPSGNTSKQILGDGSSYISLPMPLSGSVTVTAPSGYTVPDIDVTEEQRLITLDAQGNPSPYLTWDDIYYTVNGLWGYPVTPAQIKEATLQLAIHFYRGRDKALTGTITDMRTDEAYPERDYPRATRRILDEFKRNLGGKPSGGLYFA